MSLRRDLSGFVAFAVVCAVLLALNVAADIVGPRSAAPSIINNDEGVVINVVDANAVCTVGALRPLCVLTRRVISFAGPYVPAHDVTARVVQLVTDYASQAEYATLMYLEAKNRDTTVHISIILLLVAAFALGWTVLVIVVYKACCKLLSPERVHWYLWRVKYPVFLVHVYTLLVVRFGVADVYTYVTCVAAALALVMLRAVNIRVRGSYIDLNVYNRYPWAVAVLIALASPIQVFWPTEVAALHAIAAAVRVVVLHGRKSQGTRQRAQAHNAAVAKQKHNRPITASGCYDEEGRFIDIPEESRTWLEQKMIDSLQRDLPQDTNPDRDYEHELEDEWLDFLMRKEHDDKFYDGGYVVTQHDRLLMAAYGKYGKTRRHAAVGDVAATFGARFDTRVNPASLVKADVFARDLTRYNMLVPVLATKFAYARVYAKLTNWFSLEPVYGNQMLVPEYKPMDEHQQGLVVKECEKLIGRLITAEEWSEVLAVVEDYNRRHDTFHAAITEAVANHSRSGELPDYNVPVYWATTTGLETTGSGVIVNTTLGRRAVICSHTVNNNCPVSSLEEISQALSRGRALVVGGHRVNCSAPNVFAWSACYPRQLLVAFDGPAATPTIHYDPVPNGEEVYARLRGQRVSTGKKTGQGTDGRCFAKYNSEPGDSGSPVFCLSDGKYKLVGYNEGERTDKTASVYYPVAPYAHYAKAHYVTVPSAPVGCDPAPCPHQHGRVGFAKAFKVHKPNDDGLVVDRVVVEPGTSDGVAVPAATRFSTGRQEVTDEQYWNQFDALINEYRTSHHYLTDKRALELWDSDREAFFFTVFVPCCDLVNRSSLTGLFHGEYSRRIPSTCKEYFGPSHTPESLNRYRVVFDDFCSYLEYLHGDNLTGKIRVGMKKDAYSLKKLLANDWRSLQMCDKLICLAQMCWSQGYCHFLHECDGCSMIHDPTHPFSWAGALPPDYHRVVSRGECAHSHSIDYTKFDGSTTDRDWFVLYDRLPYPKRVAKVVYETISRGEIYTLDGTPIGRLPGGNPSGNQHTSTMNNTRGLLFYRTFHAKTGLAPSGCYAVCGDDSIFLAPPETVAQFVEFVTRTFGIAVKVDDYSYATPGNYYRTSSFVGYITVTFAGNSLPLIADPRRRVAKATYKHGDNKIVAYRGVADSFACTFLALTIPQLREFVPEVPCVLRFIEVCKANGIPFKPVDLDGTMDLHGRIGTVTRAQADRIAARREDKHWRRVYHVESSSDEDQMDVTEGPASFKAENEARRRRRPAPVFDDDRCEVTDYVNDTPRHVPSVPVEPVHVWDAWDHSLPPTRGVLEDPFVGVVYHHPHNIYRWGWFSTPLRAMATMAFLTLWYLTTPLLFIVYFRYGDNVLDLVSAAMTITLLSLLSVAGGWTCGGVRDRVHVGTTAPAPLTGPLRNSGESYQDTIVNHSLIMKKNVNQRPANAKQRKQRPKRPNGNNNAVQLVGHGDYRAIVRSVFNAVKSALPKGTFARGGEVIGNALVPGAGGTVGKALGGLVSKLAGFGDYTVTSNSIMGKSQSLPTFQSSRYGTRIAHREFVANVNATTAFSLAEYGINPGDPSTFPWLSTVADSYEQYKFRGLVFEFHPTSGQVTSSNPALGAIVMATSYDVYAPKFISKTTMESYEFSTSTVPCNSALHPVECAEGTRLQGTLLTRTSTTPTGANLQLYDVGAFNIASVGAVSTYVCGELWVSYDVEFYKPRIPYAVPATPASGWRNGASFNVVAGGSMQLFQVGNVNGSSYNSDFITFSTAGSGNTTFNLNLAGTYLIHLDIVRGTGSDTITALPGVVGSNLVSATSGQSNGSYQVPCYQAYTTNFATLNVPVTVSDGGGTLTIGPTTMSASTSTWYWYLAVTYLGACITPPSYASAF